MTTDTLVEEEITFASGMPGFPGAHRFTLESWGGDDSPFALLAGVDDPDLAFVIVPPWPFYPDYNFDLDKQIVERLNLGSPDDALVFVIVTLGDEPKDSSLNLLGPIVVNRRTGAAAQIVLQDSDYDVRAPISGA